MRFLHTSDWHLGRSLHGRSLQAAQGVFADFLVDIAVEAGVDVVLVAGDVFDRALPPVDALNLFDETLAALAAHGVAVVVVSGNHDSAPRLGYGRRFFERAGVHVRGDVGSVGEPVLVDDAHGSVAIHAIPYLEPELARVPLGAAAASHEAVLDAAMARVRADVAGRPCGTRLVVVAHAFVAGRVAPTPTGSERDISVGGSAVVPATLFDGADYVALGHLHGAQQPDPGRVVYCGSPIAYSFSEVGQVKSVVVGELGAGGAVALETIPCPVHQPLACLTGTLDSLLADPSLSSYEDHLLSVTLTDAEPPREPMDRLRARFPDVLQLTIQARNAAVSGSYTARLAGLDDLDVVAQFVRDMWGRPPTDDELALLQRAVEHQRIAEAVA